MHKYNICIVFDLDDTLYKEIEYVKSGRKAVACRFAQLAGEDMSTIQSVMAQSADPFDGLIEYLATKGINVSIDDILAVYRAHKPDIRLDGEVEDALRKLSTTDGVALGVITDGRSAGQWSKIDSLGLKALIPEENIIVSSDLDTDKHSPTPFIEIAKRIPAEHYIYIGDNPLKDFVQPRRLGWTAVMLRDVDGIHTHSQDLDAVSEDHRPDIVIEKINFIELNKLICRQL